LDETLADAHALLACARVPGDKNAAFQWVDRAVELRES